jgi:excisionase family DNA binding protein
VNDQPAGQGPVAPEWLTIEQAAGWLQVSTKTIRRYIEAGSLPAVNLGGRAIRIRRKDLEAWLESRRVEPGGSLHHQAHLERKVERQERRAARHRHPPTLEELARMKVGVVQENPLTLCCNTCGAIWQAQVHANGKLARQALCCPNKCNCE